MIKKASLALLLLAAAITLGGCQSGSDAAKTQSATTADNAEITQSLVTAAGQPVASSSTSAASASSASTNNSNAMTTSATPTKIIDQSKTYTAILHTTAGDMEILLNDNATPITVNNFVWLAKKNFYNGTIFHRVIKDFMIQGGDPKGDGTGGPGYQFDDEAFTGDYTRGTIAMANAGPNTNGSQFFIMHATYPLAKDYVIFGHLTKGFDVLDKIAEAPVQISSSGETSQPIDPVTVTSVEIIEK